MENATNESDEFYKYEALYKADQLIYGEPYHWAIVVTGWSVAKKIADQLPDCTYAALGQLYNPVGGLSILIRNLLYNPQISTVVYTEPTVQDRNAQSIASLVSFFQDGFQEGVSSSGLKCWQTVRARGEIEIEIPKLDLIRLRNRITLLSLPEYLLSLPADYYDVLKETLARRKKEVGNRQIFQVRSGDSKRLPGAYIGHRIEAETIAEAFPEILYRIRSTGRLKPTGNGGQIQELANLTVVINNEPDGFRFEPYLPVDAEYIKSYLPQMCEGLNGLQSSVNYTYGSRMREYFGNDQIREVIEKLIIEPDACSAVINLWDAGGIREDKSSDNQHGGSPCLNHLWFRISDNRLILIATFRSNDMYSAWVSNAMGLRHLQKTVLDFLILGGLDALTLGALCTNSLSAHIYEHCFDAADQLSSKRHKKQSYSDNVGNFLICWDVEQFKCCVSQEYPQGVAARKYSSRSALPLIRDICLANPEIRGDHSGYLALEIQKCLRLKDDYTQDVSL